MGELLRFRALSALRRFMSVKPADGEGGSGKCLSDLLTDAEVEMMDGGDWLRCQTCGASWIADYNQPSYNWIYCPKLCNAG
jgi:hypothetical protein